MLPDLPPTMSARARTCGFCGKGPFPSVPGLHCHIQQAVACRNASQQEFGKYVGNIWNAVPAAGIPKESSVPQVDVNDEQLDDDIDQAAAAFTFADAPNSGNYETPIQSPPAAPSRRATVEEVADEGDLYPGTRFVEPCPTEWKAGAIWGHGVPAFEKIREEQSDHKWGPFEDQDEWELAQWLIRNAGQKQTNAFLKLPIVRRLSIDN